jgi:hypothetical protein
MTRLTKRDAEALTDLIDREPLGVLTRMLGKVLDLPHAPWETLVEKAGFPPARAARLLAAERTALYDLAAELNELRTLEHRPP